MKSIYFNYQKIQDVLETMANILNLHIEMIDNSLTRVCGTGMLKEHIGEKVVLNGIVSQLLTSQECSKAMVMDKNNELQCKICMATNGTCKYKKAIFQTLEFENKIIGALGIASMYNDDDHEFLRYSESTLWNLLTKVTNLVFACVEDNKVLKQLEYSNEVISKIINKTDIGILVIDEFARVQHVNDLCEKNFFIKRSDSLNKDIKTVLPDFDLNKDKNKILYNGKNIDYRVEKVKSKMDKLERSIIYLTNSKLEKNSVKDQSFFDDIWGIDETFISFKDAVLQFSKTDSTILLVGETGTGKELFAKAIHNNSNRANNPFIIVNCSTIPDSLIESTLFGYEKGSFTGANATGKEGKFSSANSGTVFLDEIEAIPLHVQTKLLRVLENRTIEKVGSIKEIPINIRIVGATNAHLEELVESGKFREDLYHRLNVITLDIPPLRERKKDILFLAEKFIKVYSERLQKNIHGLDSELKIKFLNHNWRGNVRELKNIIEYAVVVEKSEYITQNSMPKNFLSKIASSSSKIKTMAEMEKEQILESLKIYGYTNEGKQNAANVLGISRATLYRKIKEYSIIE